MWPVGGGDRGRKKPRFRGCGGRGGRTTPSSPTPALTLSRGALSLSRGAHSHDGATALSPRGLSFPSDGEPLPAISSVGAATTLGAVHELLQQARRRLGFFLSCQSNF